MSSVAIVIGAHEYAERFEELARHDHVWLVREPDPQPYPHDWWVALEQRGPTVSSFDITSGSSIDDALLVALELVEDHHNEWTDPPGWKTLEVYGAALSDDVRATLQELEVVDIISTESGFICRRPTTVAGR